MSDGELKEIVARGQTTADEIEKATLGQFPLLSRQLGYSAWKAIVRDVLIKSIREAIAAHESQRDAEG